jgi:hypothetical protein
MSFCLVSDFYCYAPTNRKRLRVVCNNEVCTEPLNKKAKLHNDRHFLKDQVPHAEAWRWILATVAEMRDDTLRTLFVAWPALIKLCPDALLLPAILHVPRQFPATVEDVEKLNAWCVVMCASKHSAQRCAPKLSHTACFDTRTWPLAMTIKTINAGIRCHYPYKLRHGLLASIKSLYCGGSCLRPFVEPQKELTKRAFFFAT